jgi:hypothetical protein
MRTITIIDDEGNPVEIEVHEFPINETDEDRWAWCGVPSIDIPEDAQS